jgi:hypothetical protein
MTPQQKIKHLILLRHDALGMGETSEPIDAENVDSLYEALDEPWDAINEVRDSGIETDLSCDNHSRHYECKSVAVPYVDGSWVGFPYWYGGGKHGEPEAIDWIRDAYDLTMTQREETRVVSIFERVPA